jgi:hypothetical protein
VRDGGAATGKYRKAEVRRRRG